MTTFSAEELAAIRDSFARLLAARSAEPDVRRVMETEAGYDHHVWASIADLGLTGLIAPAEFGGAGAGPVELEMLMEEAGASLLPAPFLSSAVLATTLLTHSADDEAKARLLPDIASGKTIATVAIAGEQGLWNLEDIGVRAEPRARGWELDGLASYVTYGAQADTLLVVALAAGNVAAFEVDPRAAGVTRRDLHTFDRTQRLAGIEFRGVAGAPIAGADAACIEKTLDVGRVALAGEQSGAARRIFDVTIEYLKTRVQFGRPIGGFQALKHMAADLLIEVENATSAARQAAVALAHNTPDAQALVNLAAFACADAFVQVAATAIQMHGGIGCTWDHPAHLYLRRARADALLFGSSDVHRDRYLAALEAAQ